MQGAKGTLVVPPWRSVVFWPLLINVYYSFVQDLRVFSISQALIHGRNHNSILGLPTTPGYVLALRMNFVLGAKNLKGSPFGRDLTRRNCADYE